jgi:3-oxoacyl-[acyl-carrier protein] reductase
VTRFEISPPLTDDALNALFSAAWPAHRPRPFASVLRQSLGTIGAFEGERLIGFVNVAWDGGQHAFLLDPTVHPEFRRRGLGTELVRRAAALARTMKTEWLHVDYVDELAQFYARCGFRPTSAGLLRLDEEPVSVSSHGSSGELGGQVALVTGATRVAGIGVAIATELARAGAKLVLAHFPAYDREKPWGIAANETERIRAELPPETEVEWIELDLAAETSPRLLVERVLSRFGRLDVVVNNAAHWEAGGLDEVDARMLDRHYAVNVRAAVLLCREFARAAAHGGRVINVTSGQSHSPMPGEIAYVVTKAALDALTLTLSVELGPRGITVNAVDPGPTDTGWMSEEQKAAFRRESPASRVRAPAETARMVRYLASPAAARVTGRLVRVGMHQ